VGQAGGRADALLLWPLMGIPTSHKRRARTHKCHESTNAFIPIRNPVDDAFDRLRGSLWLVEHGVAEVGARVGSVTVR
jgi:hypothetical protein